MLALPFELFGFTQYIENEPHDGVCRHFGPFAGAVYYGAVMRLPFLKTFLGIIAGGLV